MKRAGTRNIFFFTWPNKWFLVSKETVVLRRWESETKIIKVESGL